MVCGVKGKRVEGYKLRLDIKLMGFVVLNCQGSIKIISCIVERLKFVFFK